MIKLAKKLSVILIVSVFMISVGVATSYATNTPTEKNVVEYKEKKVTTFKIKWDANGGKIGTKKTVTTTVKKGAKVKLAKAPKMTGYTFQGWYSKKTGGSKITKNTKPKKSISYYAHWKKKPKVLNSLEKKLVGEWVSSWDGSSKYIFKADGTYSSVSSYYTYSGSYKRWDYDWGFQGYYSVKNGILTLQYQHSRDYTGNGFKLWSDWETGTPKNLTFSTEDGKQYMKIGSGIWYTKV